MANTYKILGQKAPSNTNVDLYAPAASGTSAVLSTITVANTSTDEKKFSIYAQQTVPVGSIWTQQTNGYVIPGVSDQKFFFFDDGVTVFAYGQYANYQNFLHTSIDNGETWTRVTVSSEASNQGSEITSMVYLSGKFVISWTNNGIISVSPDGINWSTPKYYYDIFPVSSSAIRSIIPTSAGYLAISATKEVAFSTDGETWTEVTSNLSTLSPDNISEGSLGTSMSGMQLFPKTAIAGSTIFTIVRFQDSMMMSTTNALLKSSDDGVTWSIVDLSSYYSESVYNGYIPTLNLLSFENNKLILSDGGTYDMMSNTTTNGKILVSSDSGTTWTANTPLAGITSSMGGTFTLRDVRFLNNKYYLAAGGSMDGDVYTSDTLATITIMTPDVYMSTPRFVVLAAEKILLSNAFVSTNKTPADEGRAIFNKVALAGSSTVTLSLGISLGYGDKISVGEAQSSSSSNITYTAFGSEITA